MSLTTTSTNDLRASGSADLSSVISRRFHALLDVFTSLSYSEKFSSLDTFNYREIAAFISNSDDPKARIAKEAILTGKGPGSKRRLQLLPGSPDQFATEWCKQVTREAYSFAMFVQKSVLFKRMFYECVCTGKVKASMFVGTGFFTLVHGALLRSTAGPVLKYRLLTPTVMESELFLHALSILAFHGSRVGSRSSSYIRMSRNNGTRLAFFTQLVVRAFDALLLICGFGRCTKSLRPFLLFNSERKCFDVLVNKSSGYVPKLTPPMSSGPITVTHDKKLADEHVTSRSDEVDYALRNVTRLLLDTLDSMVTRVDLYNLRNGQEHHHFHDLQVVPGKIPSFFTRLAADVRAALCLKDNMFPRDALPVDIDGPNLQDVVELNDELRQLAQFRTGPYITDDRRVPKRKKSRSSDSSSTLKSTFPDDGLPIKRVKNEPMEILEPSPAQVNLNEEEEDQLTKILDKACFAHQGNFRDLMEDVETCFGIDISEQVQLILVDPPYNTRDATHDHITEKDMYDAVVLFKTVLRKGGHGLIFCTALQFSQWYKFLSNQKVRESEEQKSDYFFRVEGRHLNFVKAPGHYNNNPCRTSHSHLSVSEMAIHFWRPADSFKDSVDMVNYRWAGDIDCRHKAWTSDMDNIPNISGGERLMFVDGDGSRRMVRPEQKSIALMRALVRKWTNPGDLVMDCFAGTFSTAKACFDLDHHRRFIGCEKDSHCYDLSLPALKERFCKKMVSGSSNINISPMEKDLCQKYINSLQTQMRNDISGKWNMPDGLPATQVLPAHILCVLASFCSHPDGFLHLRSMTVDSWPPERIADLASAPVEMLLYADAVSRATHIAKSKIKSPHSGRGVFASRHFKRGDEVMYYYGTCVYKDMSKQHSNSATYGYGAHTVTAADFRKWSCEITGKLLSRDGKSYPIWIVPVPFCAARFINDPRYTREDEERVSCPSVRRVANVRMELPSEKEYLSTKAIRSFKLLTLVATREIRIGEELFWDYGDQYYFE